MADQSNPLLAALGGQGGNITPQSVQQNLPPQAPPDVPQQQMSDQVIQTPRDRKQQLLPKPTATTGYGMPAIISLIGQLIHPQGVTPSGPVDPSQAPQRPASRFNDFENFLGNFTASLGAGLAASGTGPGANIRGTAGALNQPHNAAMEQYQMQQQQQAAQSQQALQAAEANRANSQATMVTMPDGRQVPSAIYEKMLVAQDANKNRLDVQGLKNTGATEVQNSKNATAAKSLAEKVSEFQTTDSYRKWKTKFDAENSLQRAKIMAQASASKAPAAVLQSAIFAGGGLRMMSDAESAMQRLEAKGVMGTIPSNKIDDYLFGKGLVDPKLDAETRNDIGKLRAALGYTSSAAMRAHTGRTSREIYDDFKSRLGPGQDWSALRGAMEETGTLLNGYVQDASNSSIDALRNGTFTGGGPAAGGGAVMYARDPQGKLHQAPVGTPLPKGWKAGQ